jgi:hypothetical protein
MAEKRHTIAVYPNSDLDARHAFRAHCAALPHLGYCYGATEQEALDRMAAAVDASMTNNEAPKGQEAPERIWAWAWDITPAMGGQWHLSANTSATEYTRADLLTAALARAEQAEAELNALAIVVLGMPNSRARDGASILTDRGIKSALKRDAKTKARSNASTDRALTDAAAVYKALRGATEGAGG